MAPQEVTVDHVKAGLVLRLGPGEVFWKIDSGKVELNAFTGKLSTKVDGSKLTDREVRFVLNGIRTGRVIVVDKLVTGKPVDTKWLTSEYAPAARRLLDYKDHQFMEAARRTFSRKTLEVALELEKEGQARPNRINLLTSQLASLKG